MSIEDIADKYDVKSKYITWFPFVFYFYCTLMLLIDLFGATLSAISEGFIVFKDEFILGVSENRSVAKNIVESQKKAHKEYKNEQH